MSHLQTSSNSVALPRAVDDINMLRRQALNRLAGGAAAIVLAACGGGGGGDSSDAPANTNPATTPSPGSPAGNRQVVVVGNEFSRETSTTAGKVWVNDSETTLRVGDNGKQSEATGLAFGPEGYVACGYSRDNGFYPKVTVPLRDEATLWYSNGITQNLTAVSDREFASEFYTSGIAIDQSNAYVSGIFTDAGISQAMYWKNAVPTILTPDKKLTQVATGIFVKDTDVYVSGTQGLVVTSAVYWKNGVKSELSSDRSLTTSIAVDGSGVYVAGVVFRAGGGPALAVVWKNGVEQLLAEGYQALSIALGGFDDVYVAGIGIASTNVQVARLWKNGVLQELEGATAGSSANDVVVVGNDVYVAGHISGRGPTGQQAVLWVNGKLKKLTLDNSATKSTTAVALAVR